MLQPVFFLKLNALQKQFFDVYIINSFIRTERYILDKQAFLFPGGSGWRSYAIVSNVKYHWPMPLFSAIGCTHCQSAMRQTCSLWHRDEPNRIISIVSLAVERF